MAVRLDAGKVTMLTRRGLDWTARFAPIAAAAGKLKAQTAYLDGEVVVLDDRGSPASVHYRKSCPPRHEKDGLFRIRPAAPGRQGLSPIRFSDHCVGRGPEFFEQACSLMLEGIVSKRTGAPYRPGRSADWLKTKCTKRQEFVIGGWRRSTASGRDLGSLLVGYYRDGKLHYAGKVGTGFS
jgi:bifunctional non-homologous end joining protein LigD